MNRTYSPQHLHGAAAASGAAFAAAGPGAAGRQLRPKPDVVLSWFFSNGIWTTDAAFFPHRLTWYMQGMCYVAWYESFNLTTVYPTEICHSNLQKKTFFPSWIDAKWLQNSYFLSYQKVIYTKRKLISIVTQFFSIVHSWFRQVINNDHFWG